MNTVCYCFGYSDEDIAGDVSEHHGKSTIEERISREKAAGRCRCEARNPRGT
jgi:bacterioferritin-associated ferredoxin